MIGWSNVKVFASFFLFPGVDVPSMPRSVYSPLSAVLGHHCHCRGRCFTHSNMLLLHHQEMLLQEEEEQEGQEGEG